MLWDSDVCVGLWKGEYHDIPWVYHGNMGHKQETNPLKKLTDSTYTEQQFWKKPSWCNSLLLFVPDPNSNN